MRKYLGTSALVVFISCAAVWGAQLVKFFQRLPMAFSSLAFAADGASNQGRPPRADAQEFHAPTSPNEGKTERPQRHGKASASESWKNVLAYFAVFAFVVMLTGCSEQGLRKFAHRRDRCLPPQEQRMS